MQPVPIIYEDADLVGVDKQAGLLAIPGRDEPECLLALLCQQFKQRMLVVHRLDKETSGIMLFAKHSDAQRFLSRQFQNNTIEKEYLALVAGRAGKDEGEIDAPIGVHPTSPKKMAVVRHGGRPARTLWKVEKRFREYTLLRVFPKTGKTHQIRVHLASIGLPLAIDPLYNLPADPIYLSRFKRDYRAKKDRPERPLISRLTLHANKVTFTCPSGESKQLIAPPPKDFSSVCNQLSKRL